jgi:flagellar protein FlaG
LTQLIRALSEQAAPVTSAPPVVASEKGSAERVAAQANLAAYSLPETAAPKGVAADDPSAENALESAAKQIESYLKSIGRELRFSVDEESGRTVITVRDSSGEVVRQIPNDEALRLARRLGNLPSALIDISI